ncbi:unnamed protein product, partial [Lampetra planeri]
MSVQELQKDIEQHTEGVASVLSLCDVLLQDEDAAGGFEAESDSLQETSRSLDQRWRTICALAVDRRLRIEETWRLWCKFLDDYSRFEDWLKMAERTAANPNSLRRPLRCRQGRTEEVRVSRREITLNTERIDGLIVFGEALIQRSSPQDAALIEDELEELHSYCQEVFSRLVRFHQRLSQPQGRETPVSVDSLPLEWDHTGDVGGSSSHEDEEEEEEDQGQEEEGAYFSALSDGGAVKLQKLSPPTLPPCSHLSRTYVLSTDQTWARLPPTNTQENILEELSGLQQSEQGASVKDVAARAEELQEMQKMFTRYKPVMLSTNLRAWEGQEQKERLAAMNRDWGRACALVRQWDTSLRTSLTHCQELEEELKERRNQLAALRTLWSQLQPEDETEESGEAREKIHVTGGKLKLLLQQVADDQMLLQQHL